MREVIHTYARHGEDSCDSLTPRGRQQAEDLAKKLAEVYVGRTPKVFTSEKNRAYETGVIVGKSFNVKPEKRSEIYYTESFKEFADSVTTDAIFIGHQPELLDILGYNFRNGSHMVTKRSI